MQDRQFAVYILTNTYNKVLYTGFTNDIGRRIEEHRIGAVPGFTRKYKVKKLVYYEFFDSPRDAIDRKKQIKGWLRKKKIDLINEANPSWNDLSDAL